MIPLRIAGAGLLTYAVCMAAGQILFRALQLKLAGAERHFLTFLSGSACVSTLMLVLALVRCIYPWVLVFFAAAVLLGGMLCLRGDLAQPPPDQPAPKRAWKIAFWVAYLTFGVYYLCAAMSPEVSPDGVGYHVGLITRYFDRHGLFPMRTDMYANLSAGTEMLFLFAYAFGRHSAAAVVHLLFLLVMPFGMYAYARRMGQPLAGLAAGLLFYAAPVVGKDGASAYNDVSTAASIFGCYYALQIWRRERSAVLVPAGLLAGFAFASKYTAFPVILYALGFVLLAAWRGRKGVARPVATICMLVLIQAAPWMIKNVDYVANPVHPFLSRLFPNPYYPQRLEQDYIGYLAHMNDIGYARIPWEVTVGGRLTGILGPVFLLAPLALLSLRSSMGRQLLPAFAVMFLPYFGNIGTRFLISSLPFLALAMAAALASNPRILMATTALHLILSWPNLIPYWAPPNQWRLEAFEWRAALRLAPEEKYLAEHLADYRAGLMLDRLAPANQLIYAPSAAQLSYHHRLFAGSGLQDRVLNLLVTGYVPDLAVIRKRRYTFAPLRTRSIRLVLEGRQDPPWRIREVRFLQGADELPSQPQWHIEASDNPWEIQLAFDNSAVSEWVSSRRASPGQWVRMDFGSPIELTGVIVEQRPDQQWLRQRLEAMVDGKMMPIPVQETAVDEALGPGLRRKVAAEIKAAGIQWLLLRDGDYGGEDLRRRAPYWGAVEAGNVDGYYLWRLD